MTTHSTYLKEMGITEWSSRDASASPLQDGLAASSDAATNHQSAEADTQVIAPSVPNIGLWWFFGKKPEGNAEQLFSSMIRSLGLRSSQWCWLSPNDNLASQNVPEDVPVIAFAFGEQAAQKLSGERDSIANLRETVLGLTAEGFEEMPLIASLDLNYLISRPKEKSLLWQDLLLAKSVLQNT